MRTTSRLALALVLAAPALWAADAARPVGIWTFDNSNESLVQDRSGGGAHGSAIGATTRGKGPWGRAIGFDGTGSHVRIPDRPQLRMTNAVTVDVWLNLPNPALGHPQCVVDKGGECYRIQIDNDGDVMFGLKGDGKRADMGGGRLRPNIWHRITGVFQRPQMALYLDCKRVASGTWDHDIGPGGPLFFGAKSGVTYKMKGWLADVRIYNVARPPRPTDIDHLKQERAAMQESKLEVREADGLMVDTGPTRITFDPKGTGGIRSLTIGRKPLVRDNALPPLAASLLESGTWDGHADFVPDARTLSAAYRLVSFAHKTQGKAFEATTRAELAWPGGDTIDATLRWTATAGSPLVTLRLKLAPRGAFTNRFLRDLSVQMPLALNVRKRVVQGGDQGWSFDTRHRYQFHLNTVMRLMTEPEHNWWRHFAVEQDAPSHFRAWRSEGDHTAALTAQHGEHAPGWIAAYDQQGGLLWAYRDMHQRAPKAVATDAEGPGLARIHLHPPTARAIAIASPQASRALFDPEHRTDWVAFEGEFPFAQPTRTLAKAWGEKRLASDPPVGPKLHDIELWNAPTATGDRVPMVVGGLPLPKGAIERPDQVRLFKGEAEVPLQARLMAFWPDGSVKWLLLVFPLDGRGGLACAAGSGEGKALDFVATLRDGGKQTFRLVYGKAVRAGAVTSPMITKQAGDTVEIRTGPLTVSLGTGERWLRGVSLRGRQLLRPDASRPLAAIDFLRNDNTYLVNTTHPTGTLDPGPVRIDRIEVEEGGPLRATVRMQGVTTSQEPQRVILRLEAYAGQAAVRLWHSVEFLHKDPRRAHVQAMRLTLPLQVDAKTTRIVAGTQLGPTQLAKPLRTGLRQDSHLAYTLWQQPAGQRFATDVERHQRCRGWLGLADASGGCTAMVRNMWQKHPKEIVADPATGDFTVGLWPESHPLMDVRRYSNYPHRSQGESARSESSWVDKVYYPNDPFVGVSISHELLLAFHDAATPPEQLDAVASDFQSRPLVYVTPEWYASLGITIPYHVPCEAFARVDANLEHVTNFWLFHRKIWAWYGMWDYGDVLHKFSGWGYGWILSADALAHQLKQPADTRFTTHLGKKRVSDYHTQTDWCFDNGRWGWGNTEGNPNLFVQMQYLRTGRRDWFFAAEAMARHVRDVDMRHDGKWFGRGTRHGVQHWSDGNHEERQTVHSEWRFHHYLTGDMRSRDFARQLTERVYTKGHCRIHAAHSGRLYGLLTRWEMTGDKAIGDMLRRYVHCLVTPDGIDISADVQFPEATRVGEPREVNGASMFFHSFGAMHALLEYHELTGDAKLRDGLIRMADSYMAPKHPSYTARKAIAFAARHAPDPARYRKVLDEWMRWRAPTRLYQLVADSPKHWTGPTAFLRAGVSGQWFWLNDVLYLMSLYDREPEPPARHVAEMARINAEGMPHGFARESWQSDYDRPDLAEYLRDQRRKR